MDRDLDALLGFAPDYDAPIPYMQRTRDYYPAIGYTTPYRWAHYVEAPFPPLRKPLAAIARDHHHHRRAVPARQGRPGARRGLQRRGEVLPGLLRRHIAARTTCASRISATTASTPPPRTAAPGSRCRRCCAPPRAGPHRRGRAALPRRADQPQPPRHARDRCAGDPAPLPRGRRRRRDPGAELPGLPPDVQPGRAPSGGERHPHRGHGLRQGHRRARRRAALPVQRLPARQQRRQAARPGLAGAARWSWRCACWRPRPGRAPRCSRRCAGARMRRGSSTT